MLLAAFLGSQLTQPNPQVVSIARPKLLDLANLYPLGDRLRSYVGNITFSRCEW